MSVMLISVSHDTVVSNKHEERTRHYYVNFQHQVHFFPPIISFSRAHANVPASPPTILDSTAWILAAPARAVEFLPCHARTHVHHSSNFLPLEPSYVPGSAKIFESLGVCAPLSEFDDAGLARAIDKLWLTAFSSPFT